MLNQKLALSAVLAAAALPVCAQSTLQIYGRVNTTIEQQKLGGESMTGMFSNASRIGFKGAENLGRGLQAGFVLESGFASDDGAGSGGAGIDFGRHSELFLQGTGGLLRLGNFTPESYSVTADMVSMHNHDTGASSDALYAWLSSDVNKIAYRAPVLPNAWVEVSHALHESTSGGKNMWDVAANYDFGDLGVGVGMIDYGDNRQVAVRASYSLNQLVLGGYVQRVEMDKGNASEEAWTNYRLAAAYTLGANELHANIGYADRKAGKSATQWTLAVNRHLSQRTKLYASYTKVHNGANASYGYGFNDRLQAAVGAHTGQDFSALAVGVRHNF